MSDGVSLMMTLKNNMTATIRSSAEKQEVTYSSLTWLLSFLTK